MTSIPLQGSISEFSVPQLLLELYRDNYSGGLTLEWQRTQKTILFHEGAPVSAESDLGSETLCVLLENKGALCREDTARVEEAMKRKSYPESSALLDLGLLKPQELFAALKELVRRRTVSCFAWLEGSYALCAEGAPGKDIQPFRADPLALVQEGLEATWGVDRMLEALAPRMAWFPVSTPALSGAVARLHTDEATEAMLGQLDGSVSFGNVLSGVVRSPRALAAAWVIDASGLLRYQDAAVVRSDPMDADIEIELADAPQMAPSNPSTVGNSVPPGEPAPGGRSGADTSADEALRAEILDRLEKLSDLDFYGLLEVERNATTAIIKKSYFRAAKRYHPDGLARLGLGAMKQEAAAVFSRIAEAYEVLSDDQKRAEYNAALDSDGPEIDTTSLAQAETFYRKGEILVRMGDFRGALQYLENSVELWPEESAYQSLLGWTLYKKNPPETERARLHLDKALTLAANDAVTHFRLGMVLRALGEKDASEQALARAKELDPAAPQGR